MSDNFYSVYFLWNWVLLTTLFRLFIINLLLKMIIPLIFADYFVKKWVSHYEVAKKNYDFGIKVSHLLWSRGHFFADFRDYYFLNRYQTIKTVNGTLNWDFPFYQFDPLTCGSSGIQRSKSYPLSPSFGRIRSWCGKAHPHRSAIRWCSFGNFHFYCTFQEAVVWNLAPTNLINPYTIIDFQLELQIVELSDEGQNMVESITPFSRPVYLHANSWKHYSGIDATV